MTRKAIHHTLSALAVALAFAFASASASAQGQTTQLMSNIYKADSDAKLNKPGMPKALATQKGAENNRRPIIFEHSGPITQGTGSPNSIVSGFNSLER